MADGNEKDAQKTVFVTGAGGFIGGHVARHFANCGWRVVALVHRKKPAWVHPRVEWCTGDITDAAGMRTRVRASGATVLVHVAALASDVGRNAVFRRLNFEPVTYLAPLVQKFVFVSTADVYGLKDFNGADVATLSFEDNVGNPYPRWKIAAERWLKANLAPARFACVRPAAVWGVGDETLERRTVDFLRHSPFIVHFGKWHGRNRWPLADVRRVALACYLAATTTRWDGDGVTVLDASHTTADAYYRMIAARHFPNRTYRSITLPGWVGALLGRIAELCACVTGSTQPPFDPTYYAYRTVSSNLDFVDASFPEASWDLSQGTSSQL